MAENLVLEAKGITKTFPGVKALDNVNFSLREGEVHALVGENGAGKSTLMHILGGIHQPDSGEIRMSGAPVKFHSPHDANMKGISVVFQELSIVPNLSIAENVFANRQPVKAVGMIDRERLYENTKNLLKVFGEEQLDPRTLVRDLSVAAQQVVEILKAMSYNSKIIILDEPTSSLTKIETEKLFENIKKLKKQGISFIYISHHLNEIFEIADRVTVFRDGKYIVTDGIENMTEDKIVSYMVGRELVNMYGCRPETQAVGEEFLKVENIARKGAFQNISFKLRKGEILGFAGLVGAGRSEVARAIFGAEPADSGKVALNGKVLNIKTPSDAIRNKIGYLTEDRKQQGLVLDMDIRSNCIAPSLSNFKGKFLDFINEKAVTAFAEECKTMFRIVTPSIFRKVRNLSGGNQQKVLLSMWMGIKPDLLIVDEPTRGVDVGARSEIYHLLRNLAASGVGIIVISSDLPEVLGISDRILVMREGRLVGEFSREEASEENIIACATGVLS